MVAAGGTAAQRALMRVAVAGLLLAVVAAGGRMASRLVGLPWACICNRASPAAIPMQSILGRQLPGGVMLA